MIAVAPRSRPPIAFALALGVLFLGGTIVPAAAAAPATEGHARAASARTEGVSLLSGELLALLQESEGAPLPPAQFRLTAASVVVETTTRDPTVHAGGVDAGIDPATKSREVREATLTGLRVRPDNRLDVFALPRHAAPRLQAPTGCSDWSAAGPDDDVVRKPRIPTHADRTVSARVAEGAHVADCDGSQAWTVTGDFVVLLWQRDVEVRSAEGREELHSGRLAPHSSVTGAPAGQAGPEDSVASRDQEVYLYVANGTLDLRMDAGSKAWVRAGASAAAVPSLLLQEVTLRFGAQAPVQAAALRLEGQVDVTFRTADGLLDMSIAGAFSPVQPGEDPQRNVLGAPAAPATSPWVLGTLGMLGLLGAAALGLLVGRTLLEHREPTGSTA